MARFVVFVLVLALAVAPAVPAEASQGESLFNGWFDAFWGFWDRIFSWRSAPEKSGAYIDPSGVQAAPRKSGAYIDPSGVRAAPRKSGAYIDPSGIRVVRDPRETAGQRELPELR